MNKAFEKIIEELEKNASRYTKKYVTPYGNNGYRDTKAISVNKAIEIVNQEAEKYDNGWIPCSERLPEEAFGCLVTVMDCEPSTQTEFENILPYVVGYDGDSWNDADGNVIPFEVIAWQPLPEPFKESD